MQNYTLLAELGRAGAPGPAEARPVGDARGAPDGLRVRPQGGQRAGDAVRARDQDVRDRVPVHPRPPCRPGPPGDDPPAGPGRSEPRGRATATSSSRCRSLPRPRAPTGSSSRSTTSPRRRSATVRRRCRPESFAEYADQVYAVAEVAGKLVSRLGPPTSPPMRIAVLGVGLIGGSIGLAARRAPRRRGGRFRLRRREPGPGPRARGAHRDRGGSVAEAVAGADLVFCAAPVRSLPEVVAEALDRARPERW